MRFISSHVLARPKFVQWLVSEKLSGRCVFADGGAQRGVRADAGERRGCERGPAGARRRAGPGRPRAALAVHALRAPLRTTLRTSLRPRSTHTRSRVVLLFGVLDKC